MIRERKRGESLCCKDRAVPELGEGISTRCEAWDEKKNHQMGNKLCKGLIRGGGGGGR